MIQIVKKQRKTRKGFGLLLAVAMLAILSLVGSGLLNLGLHTQLRAFRTTKEISARAAADAGITKALFEMNKSLALELWTSDDIPSSLEGAFSTANASFTCKIEETTDGSEYRLTSVGRAGQAQKTVSVTIRRSGLFQSALLASGYAQPKNEKSRKYPGRVKPKKKGGKLEIERCNVEGFSSNPYLEDSDNLKIQTNSIHKKPVKIKKDVVINGDVVVGPGGKPEKVIDQDKHAKVTGKKYAATEMVEVLPVIVPEALDSLPEEDYKHKDDQPLTGNLKFKDFKLKKDEQEIIGDCVIYVTKDMKIEDGARLVVTDDSSLTIYVDKKLEVKKTKESGGIINETQDPTKLVIFGTDTCNKVKIEKVDDFYGAVYAPSAKVEVKDSGDIYGALVGWDVKVKGDKDGDVSNFYFDEALKSSEDGKFSLVAGTWREE